MSNLHLISGYEELLNHANSDIKIFSDFKEKFNFDVFDFNHLTKNDPPKEQNE